MGTVFLFKCGQFIEIFWEKCVGHQYNCYGDNVGISKIFKRQQLILFIAKSSSQAFVFVWSYVDTCSIRNKTAYNSSNAPPPNPLKILRAICHTTKTTEYKNMNIVYELITCLASKTMIHGTLSIAVKNK